MCHDGKGCASAGRFRTTKETDDEVPTDEVGAAEADVLVFRAASSWVHTFSPSMDSYGSNVVYSR